MGEPCTATATLMPPAEKRNGGTAPAGGCDATTIGTAARVPYPSGGFSGNDLAGMYGYGVGDTGFSAFLVNGLHGGIGGAIEAGGLSPKCWREERENKNAPR